MPTLLAERLTRRSVQDQDAPFLLRLYAAGRADEMALFPWPEAQKNTFLCQQFAARQTYYKAQFPNAVYTLLLLDALPVGAFLVMRCPDSIHLLDISLLPEQRGQGVGTALLQELIREACSSGLSLRLQVERHSPALRLYTRLGFVLLSSDIYHSMEYAPTGFQ